MTDPPDGPCRTGSSDRDDEDDQHRPDDGEPPPRDPEPPSIDPETLADVFSAIQARIQVVDAGIAGYLRTRSTGTRVGMLSAVGLLVFTGCLYFSPRADLALLPLGRWLSLAAIFIALMTWSAAVALRPFHAPVPGPAIRDGLPLAVLALALLQALLPEPYRVNPVIELGADAPHGFLAAHCIFHGALFALPGFALARMIDRGPLETLLGAGALAAVLGNLALHGVCPITDPWHLLLGHFGLAVLMLVGVVLGMGLSRRLSSP